METDQTPDNSMALLGKVVGNYHVLSRLGKGGMAQVFLAEQKSLGRLVALKILRPELAEDPSYVKRFHNEARAAAGLVHPNIVQIYEVGQADGIHFIAQEYVAGMNLSQYLRRNSAVAPLMAMNVMIQVGAALRKAASLGVVHRDIKPENIMLSTEGEVKVADFGLARQTYAGPENNMTQIGVTMGTPLYMSPEQIEGGAVDHRADLYSFGVSCYHMLTGRPPFVGENPISVAIQHAKESPQPISDFRPNLPEALVQIIEKMMAKKPADRYQDASEVLVDLKKIDLESDSKDWEELLKGLQNSSAAIDTRSGSFGHHHLAATRRLETIINGGSRWDSIRKSAVTIAMCIAGLLLAGCLFAAVNAPDTLIQQAESTPFSVPQKKSVNLQYIHATLDPSEEAWLAVAKHPDLGGRRIGGGQIGLNDLYYLRAKEQLAGIYLNRYVDEEKNSPLKQRKKSGNLNKALLIFEEFLGLPSTEIRQTSIGKYGQAYVHYQRGNKTYAISLMTNNEPLPSPFRQLWRNVRTEILSSRSNSKKQSENEVGKDFP